MHRREFLKAAATAAVIARIEAAQAEGEDRSDPAKRKDRPMNQPQITQNTISILHVTIASEKPFEQVKETLESLVPRLDEAVFLLLRESKGEQALRKLEEGPALAIFGFRDYGALLQIAGLKRRAIQYDIGNPLTASKMTRHQLSAGLYAPIRVLLRENAEAGAAFEYDRPRSVFGQFNDGKVDTVALELDEQLEAVLKKAAA
jgi:uncharacterized protein (DUF302 family)